MDAALGDKNPYEILELEKGPASSDSDIKKAYRRLALLKHPDKAKTPNAAAAFHELQQAYAVLTNKEARAALDDFLKLQTAREERYAAQSSKRQKLREELNKREKHHTTQRSEEEQARARLQEELAQLREKSRAEQRARQQQQQEAAAAKRAAESAAATSSGAQTQDETTELLMRTVKVSWDPSLGNYSTERLRSLFSQTWQVEDVILKEVKKKKHKAAALVVLGSIQQAHEAAQSLVGDLANPLLVVPYFKVPPGGRREGSGPRPSPAAAAAEGGGGKGDGGVRRAAAAGEGQLPGRPEPGAPLFPAAASFGKGVKSSTPAKPLFPGTAGMAAPAAGGPASASDKGAFASFPLAAAAFSSFPSFPSAAGGSRGASGSMQGGGGAAAAATTSFEGSVLEKMKQRTAERQRLVEELNRQEQEDGHS